MITLVIITVCPNTRSLVVTAESMGRNANEEIAKAIWTRKTRCMKRRKEEAKREKTERRQGENEEKAGFTARKYHNN